MANSKRRCPYCKEYNRVEDGVMVNNSLYCSFDHAAAYGKKNKDKGAAIIAKEQNKKTRELKLKVKSYAAKMRDMQLVFNKLRRAQEFKWFKDRGLEPVCISCQKPLGNDQWCNGHYKTTKAAPELRFDPMNSYLQHNVKCNMHDSGDIENYTKGLIIRFGEEEGNRIIEYCNTHKESVRYSDEDIARIKKDWNKQIRELEAELNNM